MNGKPLMCIKENEEFTVFAWAVNVHKNEDFSIYPSHLRFHVSCTPDAPSRQHIRICIHTTIEPHPFDTRHSSSSHIFDPPVAIAFGARRSTLHSLL